MKIVILDSYTTDQGDLSYWDEFKALGAVEIYPRTSVDEVVERCVDADAVLTNKVVLNEGVLENLPKLKYIGVLATGVNVIDLDAAKAKGVVVTNVPGYSTDSVAQSVFAYLLALYNRVNEHDAAVKAGKWHGDFCFFTHDLHALSGKTFAIVGMGAIGKKVRDIAEIFGMRVLDVQLPWRPKKEGAVALDEALSQADIISLHCPLTAETNHLVDADFLRQCRPNAILINTGRGPLIDEDALVNALDKGQIAHACLDVASIEPPMQAQQKLIMHEKVLQTPHVAWGTVEAKKRLVRIAFDNLQAHTKGREENRVA